MGKAEKKLDFEKRKIIDSYDDNIIINNNDLEQVSYENNQENDDLYINETANIIQHKIFEYGDELLLYISPTPAPLSPDVNPVHQLFLDSVLRGTQSSTQVPGVPNILNLQKNS